LLKKKQIQNKFKTDMCVCGGGDFQLSPLFGKTAKKSFGCKKYLEKNLLFF
jgi:hypothetical protein